MKLTVPFHYSVDEIPPRCRKPRSVRYDEETEIEIREVTAEEAPVAIVYRHLRESGESRSLDYRWFDGRLWTTREACGMQYENRSDYDMPTADRLCGNSWFKTKDEAIASIAKYVDNWLLVDNVPHRPAEEPAYYIQQSGMWNPGSHVYITMNDKFSTTTDPQHYFPITRRDAALAYVTEVLHKSSDKVDIEVEFDVLIPEAVRLPVFSERPIHKGRVIIVADLEWTTMHHSREGLKPADERLVIDAIAQRVGTKLCKDHMTDYDFYRLHDVAVYTPAEFDGPGFIRKCAAGGDEGCRQAEFLLDFFHRGETAPSVSSEWSRDDSAYAQREGWDLFLVNNSHYEIQRNDESTIFESDEEAIRFVRVGAEAGIPVAVKAIEIHDRYAGKRPEA